jgi:hypothetical protein
MILPSWEFANTINASVFQVCSTYTEYVNTLFLDFDGVLHPEFCHESKHFSCLPLLEEVLRQVPAYDVVVTSTWRHQHSIEALRAHFSADIQQRVIGATPRFSHLEDVPDTLLGYEREAECNAWLRDNGRVLSPWIAVDDRSWLFRPFNQFLFLVDGRSGLTAPMAEELAERLRRL